ncbi:MAG: ferredoxin [Proteobacteria bacterium]|nr:ferredoxin [Pseudomonadota bacterium]
MGKKVVIDEEECMGCEACVEIAPDIFEFNDDEEKAIVIKAEGGDKDAIQEAIDACPASCITLE